MRSVTERPDRRAAAAAKRDRRGHDQFLPEPIDQTRSVGRDVRTVALHTNSRVAAHPDFAKALDSSGTSIRLVAKGTRAQLQRRDRFVDRGEFVALGS
jgi:hypothetical protein